MTGQQLLNYLKLMTEEELKQEVTLQMNNQMFIKVRHIYFNKVTIVFNSMYSNPATIPESLNREANENMSIVIRGESNDN